MERTEDDERAQRMMSAPRRWSAQRMMSAQRRRERAQTMERAEEDEACGEADRGAGMHSGRARVHRGKGGRVALAVQEVGQHALQARRDVRHGGGAGPRGVSRGARVERRDARLQAEHDRLRGGNGLLHAVRAAGGVAAQLATERGELLRAVRVELRAHGCVVAQARPVAQGVGVARLDGGGERGEHGGGVQRQSGGVRRRAAAAADGKEGSGK